MLNGFNDDLSSLTLNLEKLMSDSKSTEIAIKNRKVPRMLLSLCYIYIYIELTLL